MEWQTQQLGKWIELCYGKALPQNHRQNGSVPVYGSNGIVGNHDKYLIAFPTIIVGRKGSVGKANYEEKPCWVIDTAFYVKTKSSDIDLRFVYHFLKNIEVHFAVGRGVKPGINRTEYLTTKVRIPFKNGKPDLAEQKRVADKLDKVFAEITRGTEIIIKEDAQTITLNKSLLKNLFSNPEWTQIQFTDLIDNKADFSLGKIQQKTYQLKGAIAVVDQGKELISGYTDKKELAYTGKLPVVVFGDHTTAVKYVDFPFVQGADGIKVLVPKNEIHPRFFYYSLINSKPKGGKYARHYKELREMTYTLPFKNGKPDLAEQKRIADGLDRAFVLSEQLRNLFGRQEKSFVGLRASVLSDAFKPETQTVPVAVPAPATAPRPFDIQQAVALILKRFERGEVVIAKMLYLGQSIYQVPLGIQFSAQNFGPYDSAVKKAVTAGLAPRNKFFTKKGSGGMQVLSLGANSNKILKYSNSALARKMNHYLNEMMPHFSASNSSAIERLATICKIIEDTKTADEKTIKEKLQEWKPNRFPDAEVFRTITFIKKNKWDVQLVK